MVSNVDSNERLNKNLKTAGIGLFGVLALFGTTSAQGFCDTGIVSLIANIVVGILQIGPIIAIGGIAISVLLWSQYTQQEKKSQWRSRGINSAAGFALLVSFDAIINIIVLISGNEAVDDCLGDGSITELATAV